MGVSSPNLNCKVWGLNTHSMVHDTLNTEGAVRWAPMQVSQVTGP